MLSTHPQQPPEQIQRSSGSETQHVWPTYYPSGGRTYLLDGSGIFVDPDTGVGLSLWIDPDMQDILGLIKAIWKEGGHVSPSHDSISTQILLISPHQSHPLYTYCHPDRLPPGHAHRQNQVRQPPEMGREEPWQVKVMLDRCWVSRCANAGMFLGEDHDWGGCRIGGPLQGVKTQRFPPSARLRPVLEKGAEGKEIQEEIDGGDSDDDVAMLPMPTRIPASRSNGSGTLKINGGNVVWLNGNGKQTQQPSQLITLNSRGSVKSTNHTPAPLKLQSKASTQPEPPQTRPQSQSQSQSHSQVSIQPSPQLQSIHPRPTSPTGSTSSLTSTPGAGPSHSNVNANMNSSSTSISISRPLSRLHPHYARRSSAITIAKRPAEVVDTVAENDDTPYTSDGEWPEEVHNVVQVDRNSTLGDLAEMFRVEKMMLGPGVREKYLIATFRQKYGTYSLLTWRDLYLSWLHQTGQYAYLLTNIDNSHLRPTDLFNETNLQPSHYNGSTPQTKFMDPSTLSWTDVNMIFEKESEKISKAGLSNEQAGEYLADKYGVYISATWASYFARWQKQRSSKGEESRPNTPAPPSFPIRITARVGPAPSSAPNPPTLITTGNARPSSSNRPGRRRKSRSPSSIELSDLSSDSSDDEVSPSGGADGGGGSRTGTTGNAEYMTNEMMCQIFEKGYKGWEMKGMSRADIAVELEKTVGVYMQGSWQIYYTNWKTKKGRFAYLAKEEKEKEKRRNKERERAKKDGEKEKGQEREKKNPTFFFGAPLSGPTASEFAYPQDLAMTKPPRKRAKALTSKHSFTEDEERAMAAHVVNNGLTTVLPSYLTWQTWSENPEGFPKRTPTSYATHCWKFRDRMESFVAELKGTPDDKRYHGELMKTHTMRGDKLVRDPNDLDVSSELVDELESENAGGDADEEDWFSEE
ncbi:hypothetical protein C343_04566 [Cryptococcus neoformans C23]|uniref:Uncharacterized protein n=2 Tax=Cryptococcus neoformans TaxID=5207 RepID=A0A854Q8P2_CRYNE|nr:hypothetical protein CNAG_03217 [Cryptococcus neoformans var. grubii H99]AUB26362.1 hypothetical protein CKF44_03217 [Cryptococcus neoformans var. grubii]OWZ30327.1 hypothetical protein C347_04613 [Cryptococcus neoformans var. grubii AD2-60a]OWZ42046.1 hypothetical protein C343_04566 [Cryptococcus neoformans var. grubii C23]OXC83444.1 hypothetical protein C344_04293 [Cryptococcus neoformans var. grubii AD1-7a]OXG17778.1 hypothetical protein C361_04773 [Cryptococcus neoformans var. grubii Tu|eukprot:XP_012051104.1 hypothetical protein CNAG_03217 [Cryptococcus neoformans var. grubii H99]